jgi:hypothetical protein
MRARLPLLLALLASGGSSVAHAQNDKRPIDDRSPYGTHVGPAITLTSSGGVSKGAYLAGVDWAIVQWLRQRRATGDTNHLIRSITGASAGNINSLLNAMAWCTAWRFAAEERPDQSAHWTLWVNTGLPQLLPTKPDGQEAGLFDRRFFEAHHEPHLRRMLDSSVAQPGCDVAVGVTITRVQPERILLKEEPSLPTRVQRFASVFKVNAQNGRVRFAPVSNTPPDASLGAVATVPALLDPHADVRAHLRQLFDVLLASSSFPIIFAPRTIAYRPGGLVTMAGTADVETSEFADGGIFDNNPLALAQRLLELKYRTGTDTARAIAMFANPGMLRGDLAQARPAADADRPRQGIGGALQLFTGAFASAQDYELQSYRRLSARDAEDGNPAGRTWWVSQKPATRSSPIVGEQLRSFAGFTGRLFREYDFYAGLYDGLHAVAQHLACPARSDTSCVQRTLDSLVHANPLFLDSISQTVVEWHLKRSVPTSTIDSLRGLGEVNAIRLRAHSRLFIAMSALRQLPRKDECKRGGLLARELCRGGGRWLIDQLASDRTFMRDVIRLCTECLKPTNREMRASGACSVDPDFVEYLEDPDGYLNRVVDRLLMRLVQIEEQQPARRPPVDDAQGIAEALTMLYRSTNHANRRGFESNPGSWKWDFSTGKSATMSVAAFLLPNYVHVGRGQTRSPRDAAAGTETRWGTINYGWKPAVWHVGGIDVGVAYELARARVGADTVSRRATDHRVGLSVTTHRWRLPGTSSVSLQAFRAQSSFARDAWTTPGPLIELATRFGQDKATIGIRAIPRRDWQVVFGLTDLGGIAYWWIR